MSVEMLDFVSLAPSGEHSCFNGVSKMPEEASIRMPTYSCREKKDLREFAWLL
jgi:hypothetical protein